MDGVRVCGVVCSVKGVCVVCSVEVWMVCGVVWCEGGGVCAC